MKKGHRRTQSSYVSRPDAQALGAFQKDRQTPNNIILLVKESQNKMKDKIINYERLQINNQQQNNFLSFGNSSINQFNNNQRSHHNQQKFFQQDLISIQENSKSSEISSKKMSHQGLEEQIPEIIKKPKRVSDFYQRTEQGQKKKQFINSQKNAFPGVRHKKIKSFKIK